MGNTYAGGVYIVIATRGDETEYWAAATPRGVAVSTVQQMLAPGWTASLSERRLPLERVMELRLKKNDVEKLKLPA